MDKKIKLPEEFLARMERLLGSEYEDFLESYEKERHYGLRRNPLKASKEDFLARIPFHLEPVSWAEEGYYYQAKEQPGRHILHEAGAYYIQEPSAMAVAEILAPRPGEYILDLCAAPGGKSTQIAGKMQGQGLLVSNEIVQSRAKILSHNVERMGVRNCVVCNETPERMASFFPSFFDRIAVDAPCSGEGMFRKDDTAVEEWSAAHVGMCAERQSGILDEAALMLKPGGVLVYSTCTFSPDENESVVSAFLRAHEEFTVEKVDCGKFFAAGRPDWIDDAQAGVENTMRLWPHLLKGEGHYIARFRKGGISCANPETKKDARLEGKGKGRGKNGQKDIAEQVQHFLTEELGLPEDWMERNGGILRSFGENVYLMPSAMPPIEGMKIVRPGLHLVTNKKNRMEPAHSLALALHIEETDRVVNLTREEAGRYFHGESLSGQYGKGWTLMSYLGYPLGFGKVANGQIKNHYPKGLRR